MFHLTPKDGVYAWFSIFSNGRFVNNHLAIAKNNTIIPQQINYRDTAKMRLRELSIGWKKYLKGSATATKQWSMYGSAGLGLIFGTINNKFSVSPDTSLYNIPVYEGSGSFKRLTVDLGLGIELPVATDFYVYSELRAWIPTSSYPSKLILVNDTAPLVGILTAGIRILF